MSLTDDEVALLYRHATGDRKAYWERDLRNRTRWELLRKRPSRHGHCTAHGKAVAFDDKGAMATGYPYHVGDDGRFVSNCDDFKGITLDPPTDEERALDALIEVLR